MTNTILQALLLFLPAGISNMTPVLINKIPILNTWDLPLDFGKKYKGQRIFGDNKRWRGLLFGTLFASITAVILEISSPDFIPFTSVGNAMFAGLAMGFGALVGDAVESFFKRQKGISPGQSWFPFDQTDYVIGGLVFAYPFIQLSIQELSIIFIAYFGLHIASTYLGFMLKLKDQPI